MNLSRKISLPLVLSLGFIGWIVGAFINSRLELGRLSGQLQVYLSVMPVFVALIFTALGCMWKTNQKADLPTVREAFNIWRVFFVLSIIFIPVTIFLDFFATLGIRKGGPFNDIGAYFFFVFITCIIHAGLIFLFRYMSRKFNS